MDAVFIKETDSKYLEFFAPEKHYTLTQLEYFSVRFKSQAVDAVARVYAYEDGYRLAALFQDMADHWTGWRG